MAKRTGRQPTEAEKAATEMRDAAIREETLAFFEELRQIEPPAGHAWELSRNWDSWFSGDLKASCEEGISFMLRSQASCRDPQQLHAEIRVHRGALRDWSFRPEGAIVWCERGARIAGSPRIDHVRDGSLYVGCDAPTHALGPAGHRHVYASDWATMSETLLGIVSSMLAADAALVVSGTALPQACGRLSLAA